MTAAAGTRAAAGPGPAVLGGLLERSLVIVSGKGGVGKTTVATTLAVLAAEQGRRVILVEVAGRRDAPLPVTGPGRPEHITVDATGALREYVRRQLPRPAAAVLLAGGTFRMLVSATPGTTELLTIGKVWELTGAGRPERPDRPDLVVLDAPAAGHLPALLHAPATFAGAARTGPVRDQARRVDALLHDPAQTALVAVTTAEDLAVAETLDLRGRLQATLGMDLQQVVVNAMLPDCFDDDEVAVLRAQRRSRWRQAALDAAARARHARRPLQVLHGALDGAVPVATLPFLFQPRMDLAGLHHLARVLRNPRA